MAFLITDIARSFLFPIVLLGLRLSLSRKRLSRLGLILVLWFYSLVREYRLLEMSEYLLEIPPVELCLDFLELLLLECVRLAPELLLSNSLLVKGYFTRIRKLTGF